MACSNSYSLIFECAQLSLLNFIDLPIMTSQICHVCHDFAVCWTCLGLTIDQEFEGEYRCPGCGGTEDGARHRRPLHRRRKRKSEDDEDDVDDEEDNDDDDDDALAKSAENGASRSVVTPDANPHAQRAKPASDLGGGAAGSKAAESQKKKKVKRLVVGGDDAGGAGGPASGTLAPRGVGNKVVLSDAELDKEVEKIWSKLLLLCECLRNRPRGPVRLPLLIDGPVRLPLLTDGPV